MLDPGVESIITGLASPAILTVIGFVLKKYLEKLEGTLKSVTETISAIQVRIAVSESRTGLVDEFRKDVVDGLRDELRILRDEHTNTKSKIDAAWRALNIKRMS